MDIETRWWVPDGDKIACRLCPRACVLPEGKRGFCFVRQNVGSKMVLTTYGRSTGFCIDPIEKKPLNHFYPGSAVLSFGTAGCNLGCKFCQNWDISKAREIEILSAYAAPEAIVETALHHGCQSIAFTYNDPVIWAEYAIDTAKAARERGIKTVAVTAGYITAEARPDFYRWIDAANVDLKAFDEEFYRSLTLSHLEPVLDTLKWLKHESSVWFEITNLIIPGENDSPDETRRMCDWIVSHLGPDVPVHFSAFHPDYKMTATPPTPHETLVGARQIALEAGIRYAYVGNVDDPAAESTYCPSCGAVVIARNWYELGRYALEGSSCAKCGVGIAGVFGSAAGSWGRRRKPVEIMTEKAKSAGGKKRFWDRFRGRSLQEQDSMKKKKKQTAGQSLSEISFHPRTEFSPQELEQLKAFARGAVESAILGTPFSLALPPDLGESPAYGIFVTLERGKTLRACRGRWGGSEPQTLGTMLKEAAADAALRDPRFPALSRDELPFLTVELSLMYDPHCLDEKGEARKNAIKVGDHGLAIIHPLGRGLLLPQVATEHKWNEETFLDQVAQKAGLPAHAWKDDEAEIISYRGVLIKSEPALRELPPEAVAGEMLVEMLQIANLLSHEKQQEFRAHRILGEKFDGPMGLEIQIQGGSRFLAFGAKTSPLELLQRCAKALGDARAKRSELPRAVVQVIFLTQPIPLRASDYPNRFGTLLTNAVVAQAHGKTVLITPRQGDPIQEALRAVGSSYEEWAQGKAVLLSYGARAAELRPQTKRPSAVGGRFYPLDAQEAAKEVERYLAAGGPWEVRETVPAVLLPHAGWMYCGEVIGRTLARIQVPKRALLIGPKHHSEGARWSLAPHDVWEINGAAVPLNHEFGRALIKACREIVPEPAAHQHEHCLEVQVPFLRALNPQVEIVPLLLGHTEFDETKLLAEAIARALKESAERPLLVVSSDMNHYAPEDENRRRDYLALDTLRTLDPRALYDVCKQNDVSMCGMLPAVVALQVLHLLYHNVSVDVVDYRTSAEASGDSSAVVGYAGIIFRGDGARE